MEAWEAAMEGIFLQDIWVEVGVNLDEVGTPYIGLVAVYPKLKCRLSLTWQVQDFQQKYRTRRQTIERAPALQPALEID